VLHECIFQLQLWSTFFEGKVTYLMSLCDAHFTTTGTLGLQSALAGLQSVVTESYYSKPRDFHILGSRDDVAALPGRVLATAEPSPEQLRERQTRIAEQIVRGTIYEDLYSRNGLDGRVNPTIAAIGRTLGQAMHRYGRQGLDWHGLA
jgi:hypothetical protein